MTDRECSNQHQHLPPVLKQVNCGESSYEKDMINRGPVDNMFPSDLELKNEIAHVHLALSAIGYWLLAFLTLPLQNNPDFCSGKK